MVVSRHAILLVSLNVSVKLTPFLYSHNIIIIMVMGLVCMQRRRALFFLRTIKPFVYPNRKQDPISYIASTGHRWMTQKKKQVLINK